MTNIIIITTIIILAVFHLQVQDSGCTWDAANGNVIWIPANDLPIHFCWCCCLGRKYSIDWTCTYPPLPSASALSADLSAGERIWSLFAAILFSNNSLWKADWSSFSSARPLAAYFSATKRPQCVAWAGQSGGCKAKLMKNHQQPQPEVSGRGILFKVHRRIYCPLEPID